MVDQDSEATEFDFRRVLDFAKNDPNGPGERTKRVFTHLVASGQFTNWDILCFATEYIASMVGTLPWLEPPARWLVRLVYMAHYIRFEKHQWLDSAPLSDQVPGSSTESGGGATSGP